jgi:hypothetical protein
MIKISLNIDMSGMLKKMALAREELPKATAIALTETAKGVRDDLYQGMRSAFGHVSNFTTNSLYVTFADKRSLERGAIVGIKQRQQQYLRPEIFGGSRDKGIEKVLAAASLPPTGMYAVPTRNSKLTGGRVSLAWLRKVVSQLLADTKAKKRRNATTVFALLHRKGGLPAGIYAKRGGTITPLLLFVASVSYSPRFDFYGAGEASARRRFPSAFQAALERAKAKLR